MYNGTVCGYRVFGETKLIYFAALCVKLVVLWASVFIHMETIYVSEFTQFGIPVMSKNVRDNKRVTRNSRCTVKLYDYAELTAERRKAIVNGHADKFPKSSKRY